MGLGNVREPSFNNEFNIATEDILKLELKENSNSDNCLIWNKNDNNVCYSLFILDQNSITKTICNVSFYKSSTTGKYLPRLIFKKTKINGDEREVASNKPIIISFNDSKKSIPFWKLITFLYQYKELVDVGDFEKTYKLAPQAQYWIEFDSKSDKEKVSALKELILRADLNEDGIRSIVFESRKKQLNGFLYLLKDINYQGESSLSKYKKKYTLRGEEAVWHHFLRNNNWFLGLNVDIKFIQDFYDEQKLGIDNSKGRNSPQGDILGISNFTTLIELKHPSTKIFKTQKTPKSRANTWDFSNDFIEGISQCLSQKNALEKSFDSKVFVNNLKERLDRNKHKTVDPNVVFIIGNRENEFPHDNLDDNHIRSDTFERFRRNNRNVDIITYDELFERAYFIIFSKPVPKDWNTNEDFRI
jgi:hypothetical protein